MAVKVVEVELTRPFPQLDHLDPARYTHLQILVRQNRRPIGYAWVENKSPRFLQEACLRHSIEQQLFAELNQASLADLLVAEETAVAKPDWPHVTVAICTRDRVISMRRTLDSLLALDYPPENLDLLVVDNAPPDDSTARLIAEFPHIRYVVEPRPGLDWARNRAVQEALGSIVAFTDDDVAIDSQWVKALVPHFANEAVMCVTGLVAPAARETAAQNIFEDYGGFGRGFETRYYTMEMQKHWRYWPLGAGIFGTGCNMAYRKSLFAQIGAFDPALDVGTPSHGAGDHDMFYRTLRAGYVLVYEPAALIWHYHRASFQKLQSQLYDFGRGVYAFWTKTFLTDAPMRWKTLTFAMLWYGGWFGKRLLRRSGSFPRSLVLAEALGALRGPLAYWQAVRQARRIARQFEPQAEKVPSRSQSLPAPASSVGESA
ncbi:MAG: glycosyltransferase [Anaerolineaceae bacterium]|nr:glycosyltransferase [Anaerolineaceae bacterium]